MLLAAAVVLLLVPCQQAAAAEGVFFDPDSPAGKEYALPLDQARDEAAGIGKSDGPAGEKAPLFGEGVSRRGSDAGPGSSGTSVGGGSGADHAENGGGETKDGQQHRASTAVLSSAAGGYALSSGVLWVAALLTLGGIVALVLRFLQRPQSN